MRAALVLALAGCGGEGGVAHVDLLEIEFGQHTVMSSNDRVVGVLGAGTARLDVFRDVTDCGINDRAVGLVRSGGALWTAGYPGSGLLARDDASDEDAWRFTEVRGLPPVVDVEYGGLGASVQWLGAVITLRGEVWTWLGTESAGQTHAAARVGPRSEPDLLVPAPVEGISGAVGIDVGERDTFAWTDSHLFHWGQNGGGQRGDGTSGEVVGLTEIALPRPVVSACVGEAYGLAATEDGALWMWGMGPGHIMEEVGPAATLLPPTEVAGVNDAVEVACTTYFALALGAGGDVRLVTGWGEGQAEVLPWEGPAAAHVFSGAPTPVATALSPTIGYVDDKGVAYFLWNDLTSDRFGITLPGDRAVWGDGVRYVRGRGDAFCAIRGSGVGRPYASAE